MSINKQDSIPCVPGKWYFSTFLFSVFMLSAAVLILTRLYLVHIHIEAYTNSDWMLLPSVLLHDFRLIALMLSIFVSAIFLPRLNIFWITLNAGLIGIYCIDIIIFYTLSHRLYLSDISKFSKDIGTVREVGGQLLSDPMGVLLATVSLAWIASAIGWCITPHKRPRWSTLIFMCIVAVIVSLYPLEQKFVRYDICYNVLENNLKSTVDKPFSSNFKEELLKSPGLQKNCQAGLNRKPNIIVLTVESFSSYHSKLFSGILNATPKLDAIAKKNTYFTNFTANGFTTDQGLTSLFAGLNPLPAINRYNSTNVYLGFEKATNNFYKKIQDIGYETAFLQTASLKFLNQEEWLKAIGFQHIEDSTHKFYDHFRKGNFGAAEDSALYLRLLDWIDERKSDKPFFVGMMTTSSHPPFIDPGSGLKDMYSTFQYVDETLSQLVFRLEERGFFNNGILLITGDHRSMTPLTKEEIESFGDSAFFRIPLIVIGSHDLPYGEVTLPFQQIDLLPSILYLVSSTTCITANQGLFLGGILKPAEFRLHVSGYERNLIYVDNGHKIMPVKMNGDATRFIGENPGNDNEIVQFINQNRARLTALNNEYNLYVVSEIRKTGFIDEKIYPSLPEPYNISDSSSGGVGNFDNIQPKLVKDKIFLSGWAIISSENGVLPERVAIGFQIKNKELFILPEIVERKDVADYFKNDNLLKCGFGFYVEKDFFDSSKKISIYQLFNDKVYKCSELDKES